MMMITNDIDDMAFQKCEDIKAFQTELQELMKKHGVTELEAELDQSGHGAIVDGISFWDDFNEVGRVNSSIFTQDSEIEIID